MKKSIFAFLLLGCLLFSFFVPVAAAETTADADGRAVDVEFFDDGSYLVTVTTAEKTAVGRSNSYSVTGAKEVTLYNDDDEIQWIYTLYGIFTVETGVSAVCTEAYHAYEIFDFDWKETSHSEWFSGNVAYGESVFKKKVLFITTSTQEITAEVGCDVYGVIS